MHYIAQIHTDAPGIGFSIADLPGFAAHIETADLDSAVLEAQSVLRDYLAAMVDNGMAAPEARGLDEVMKELREEAEPREEIAVIALRAILPAGRTLRANLSLDEHVLALIDQEAKARGLTRSAYVTAAAYAFAGVGPHKVTHASPEDAATHYANWQHSAVRAILADRPQAKTFLSESFVALCKDVGGKADSNVADILGMSNTAGSDPAWAKLFSEMQTCLFIPIGPTSEKENAVD